ncbi:MAG: hypothetical protein WA667_20560 [Candidatus Nitrosopolaris sp.]
MNSTSAYCLTSSFTSAPASPPLLLAAVRVRHLTRCLSSYETRFRYERAMSALGFGTALLEDRRWRSRDR